MDGPFLADTFSLLPDAQAIARFLLTDDVEQRFPHVRAARLAFILQQPALTLHGQPCDAYIAGLPVQGAHRLLWPFLVATFASETRESPDFLIYVDQAAWDRRGWNPELGPSGFPIEREHLVYHELCHLRQLVTKDGEPRYHRDDGREMLALARHTYEFFDTELRRYGPLTTQLEQVGTDFVAGAKAEKARAGRGRLRVA